MPVDSRTRPARLSPKDAPPESALTTSPDAPPEEAASRLARWLPRLGGLVTFAYRVGQVSAVSALVLWWALAGRAAWALGGMAWGPALGLLLLLLLPAGAAWLLGLTLHDILTLPETLRRGAAVAVSESKGALTAKKGNRIAGAIRAIWAARAFVLSSKGAWAKAATAARVVRLAKLPFVLGLTGMFALNGLIIAGGLIALLVLVL